MMKKVLALVVVFAMAGLANAGLQYQINGVNYDAGAVVDVTNPSVTVALFNTETQAFAYEIGGVALNGDGAFSNGVVIGANLPGTWQVENFGLNEGYGEVFGITYVSVSTNPTLMGNLFEFTFSFTKPEVDKPRTTIGMIDQNWNAMGAPLTVNLIPEPMTLSLLGLGALVLRRRS